jgi:hypothetical protein
MSVRVDVLAPVMGGLTPGRVKVRRVFRGNRGLEGRSILVEGLGSSKVRHIEGEGWRGGASWWRDWDPAR